ncbi:RagB/SusD family nutrient uptake outer membrane protein [Pedobacter heparinus]|nr:RagB/SusD family nutrient uptake outer membrane protein [Pedobacter heparinus]
MKTIYNKLLLFIVIVTSVHSSCKSFLDIDPPKDSATPNEMFANDATATSAITGIYNRMGLSGAFSGNQNSISVLCGLSADELRSYSSSLDVFYKNDLPTTNTTIETRLWQEPYAYIYTANAVLDGLKSAQGVSAKTKSQLEGEAKFVRAFCYFYLVNLFGDVPLILITDYSINQQAGRSSKEDIYTQIISDLIDAENLLPSSYITTERVRPNKWTATALLSRTYLYTQKWGLAAQKAGEVIDQRTIYNIVDNLDQVFLKNSNETIWQLMPTAGSNTKEGALFILTTAPTNVALSPDFVTAFETGDNRKTKWISQFSNSTGTYSYPFKYKIRTTVNGIISEYSMVLRLAEMYLIRAEALANLQQADLALADINLIRKRAGLIIPLANLTSAQCLTEIEKQRRFELFSEWGHRWLDLKRTNRASAILEPIKSSSWNDTDVLYPIPENERARNQNIGQNLGY